MSWRGFAQRDQAGVDTLISSGVVTDLDSGLELKAVKGYRISRTRRINAVTEAGNVRLVTASRETAISKKRLFSIGWQLPSPRLAR